MKNVLITVVIPPEETASIGKSCKKEVVIPPEETASIGKSCKKERIEKERIEVEISWDELLTLHAMTAAVAGDSRASHRKYVASFESKVYKATRIINTSEYRKRFFSSVEEGFDGDDSITAKEL